MTSFRPVLPPRFLASSTSEMEAEMKHHSSGEIRHRHHSGFRPAHEYRSVAPSAATVELIYGRMTPAFQGFTAFSEDNRETAAPQKRTSPLGRKETRDLSPKRATPPAAADPEPSERERATIEFEKLSTSEKIQAIFKMIKDQKLKPGDQDYSKLANRVYEIQSQTAATLHCFARMYKPNDPARYREHLNSAVNAQFCGPSDEKFNRENAKCDLAKLYLGDKKFDKALETLSGADNERARDLRAKIEAKRKKDQSAAHAGAKNKAHK